MSMKLPRITDDQLRLAFIVGLGLYILISFWKIYKMKPVVLVLPPDKPIEKPVE